ncbi:MAG: hypothetical protein GX496_09795 [Firmicutes bacterium]|uniref:MazG-like family protein n=1 Tax=Geochorda subterranea TaxID=3109564 RepID=A0ABZ1BPG2_9FIRM|nr:MazG-like family protein [Limnochorda sp. LNt]NLG69829.1 hypothetical protein [Bacillota bacterium]WRP14682.1 MazG-like family protein [Limnochorda sp. LNt]
MEEPAAGRTDGEWAKNLRAIEHLKAEMAAALANLYRAMLRASDEAVTEALAALVIAGYLLARRLGISPARLDMKIETRLRTTMAQGHELEQWYGDFTALYRHFQGGTRR